MKIIQLEVGSIGTNCYIAACEKTNQAMVIDPGGDAERILAAVSKAGLTVAVIVNTHGHFDHVLANMPVKKAAGAPLLIHGADADMLTSAQRNLSVLMGSPEVCGPADRILSEGDIVQVGELNFKVLHTPGHTLGGICLVSDKTAFVGDTLFAESIGRSDFPGGSYSQLINSIKEKLMVLDEDVKAYPGHGPATTIGWEKRHNPFIQ